ncbi:glycosyltransferase [Rhodopseudomonas palustris]|uniref:glycosyltransferase n=1 Tax=Rhodopseudomonas palustris TaxID=1076 RepID=UPI0032DFB4C2
MKVWVGPRSTPAPQAWGLGQADRDRRTQRCGGAAGHGLRSRGDTLASGGGSNALLEGLARGVSTIASLCGNVDAVEDGVTGLLVPAASPAVLAAAILERFMF